MKDFYTNKYARTGRQIVLNAHTEPYTADAEETARRDVLRERARRADLAEAGPAFGKHDAREHELPGGPADGARHGDGLSRR